mgnify:CR=1 FL=1
MKTLICNFSGYKIYPGHGIRYVRGDSKTLNFVDSKSAALFLAKKNPRKVHWTTLYRRVHKKGIVEVERRRRNRRNAKMQRAIVGASLDVIRAKKNMKAADRQSEREKALREVKEKKKAQRASKAEKKAKSSAQKSQQKANKSQNKGKQPRAGGKGGKR